MPPSTYIHALSLHDALPILAAQGAYFGVKNGWERPNWFARDDIAPIAKYSFGRQNWFACHAAEHRAARENVAIFDQTGLDRKSTRLNSSHVRISYAVFCLKK